MLYEFNLVSAHQMPSDKASGSVYEQALCAAESMNTYSISRYP